MMTLGCPSCGAAVNFHSKASVFAVCSFCKTTLVRHDKNLTMLGKMGDLQDESSPLQIGTVGRYQGKSFEIIGRLQVFYSEGFWNEWYCLFAEGREAWLAEAQGFYAICFSLEDAYVPSRSEIEVGSRLFLKDSDEFMVDDIHDVECRYSEGELPMNAARGRKSTSVDLRGPNQQMATIEYAEDCNRVFAGSYQDFDEFKFANLRPKADPIIAPTTEEQEAMKRASGFDYKAAKAGVKSFACKSCGAAIELRCPGQSLTAICSSCQSVIDVSDENYEVIQTFHAMADRFKPAMELGSVGELFGHKWEVVGFLVREDVSSHYQWREYLLYHREQGFRWLAENDGHWSFVRTIKEVPEIVPQGVIDNAFYKKEKYRLFDRGQVRIVFVLGEFYWRIYVNSTVHMEDYVCPPKMLSREKDQNEVNWSICEYVDRGLIKKAFKVKKLPSMNGIAANQPCAATRDFKQLLPLWFGTIVVLTLVQFVFLASSKNQTVCVETGFYTPNTKSSQTITTKVFKLDKDSANLDLQFKAPVDNSWFYVSGELVNDDTGVTYPFDSSVEYYYGYDGGESWSEGSRSNELLVSSIPGGKYYINYDYESGSYKDSAPRGYEIDIVRDVPTYANYLWSLFFVSVIPIIYWFASHSFEVKRWSNSDYSPYPSSEE